MRLFIVIFSLLVFALTGCQSSHQLYEVSDIPYGRNKDVSKGPVTAEFFGDVRQIQALDMSGEAFNTVGEWYDNESVLFVTDEGNGSNIFRYNIYTGKKELFFTTPAPVITMRSNNDHSLFVLHTSDARNNAKIIIIDKNGEQKYQRQIESYDIFYSWNPYQSDNLFLTSFLEDWTFQTFQIDISKQKVKEHQLSQPFVQWLDSLHLAFLKWNQDEPSFHAPLYKFNVETGRQELLFEEIISFTTFTDLLLTVEMNKELESHGIYRFINPSTNKKMGEFTVPLLTEYSKWHIPQHGYVQEEKLFYTFKPYKTGEFDTYSEKYELIAFHVETGEVESILQQVDNKPIKFSPNGKLCLYGYQLENIIDLSKKEVNQLINM